MRPGYVLLTLQCKRLRSETSGGRVKNAGGLTNYIEQLWQSMSDRERYDWANRAENG